MKALQARVHHLEAQLVEMNSEPWRLRVQAILENGIMTQQTKDFGRFFWRAEICGKEFLCITCLWCRLNHNMPQKVYMEPWNPAGDSL